MFAVGNRCCSLAMLIGFFILISCAPVPDETISLHPGEMTPIVPSTVTCTPLSPRTTGISPEPERPKIKHIILLIGDGMGFGHLQAGEPYRIDSFNSVDRNSSPSSDNNQAASGFGFPYDQFPVQLAVSTYMAYEEIDECHGVGYDPDSVWGDFDHVKDCFADSAATATAISTGVKTYKGAIGFDLDFQPLTHIIELVENIGWSTGVVTSVQFSHATPASFVVHNSYRGNYSEIAQEMIFDSPVDVIMGAGHPWFDENGEEISIPNTFDYIGGETSWVDLLSGTAGNDADGDGDIDTWSFIQTRPEFIALMDGPTPSRVLGVAQVGYTLQQTRDGDTSAEPFEIPLIESVPTLEEMTRGALNILGNDPDGFFLMVEGGAIDWASHENQFGRMIEEQIGFERAIIAVLDWVSEHSNWEETLLIITSDHETGYLSVANTIEGDEIDIDDEPSSSFIWHSVKHTNSLVPLFAVGSGSDLLRVYAWREDPVRGKYLDNTDINRVIRQVLATYAVSP